MNKLIKQSKKLNRLHTEMYKLAVDNDLDDWSGEYDYYAWGDDRFDTGIDDIFKIINKAYASQLRAETPGWNGKSVFIINDGDHNIRLYFGTEDEIAQRIQKQTKVMKAEIARNEVDEELWQKERNTRRSQEIRGEIKRLNKELKDIEKV